MTDFCLDMFANILKICDWIDLPPKLANIEILNKLKKSLIYFDQSEFDWILEKNIFVQFIIS